MFLARSKMVLRTALQRALRKPAPSVIPRSLPRAAGVDCYVVVVEMLGAESVSVLVDSVGRFGIVGRTLLDGTYELPVSVQWVHLASAKLEISRFLGVYEFQYESALKFILHEYLRIPEIGILRDRVAQFRFNQLRLNRRNRIEILRLMLESSLENSRFHTSGVGLAGRLYSNRLFFHPEKERMLNHCTLLLNSLVSSGDLTLQEGTYRITPKALATLSQFEEEDRRHTDMLAQQKALKWFTAALIFVGMAQVFVSWKS